MTVYWELTEVHLQEGKDYALTTYYGISALVTEQRKLAELQRIWGSWENPRDAEVGARKKNTQIDELA